MTELRKIWTLQQRTPKIVARPRNSLDRAQEWMTDIDSLIVVRYVHKETDKCYYTSSCEDGARPWRQLKDSTQWFHSEREALEELDRRLAAMIADTDKWLDALLLARERVEGKLRHE